MNGPRSRNVPASVRQRLLDLSRAQPELGDFGTVLARYAIERLLYRLSVSPHRDRFVLKGAQLFVLWMSVPHRPTRDVDLLGRGDNTPAALLAAFREVIALPDAEDGLSFDPATLRADSIQRDEEYLGIRIRLVARLAKARIPVQIDVGYGDAVSPPPQIAEFPSLLGQPRPRILVYARETMVAEKLEAMASLGAANTRMKDFYDVAAVARAFDFDGGLLAEAVRRTFQRRDTAASLPLALTPAFAAIEGKEQQWRAFLRKAHLPETSNLADTTATLATFLGPVLDAVEKGVPFSAHWRPGGPWI